MFLRIETISEKKIIGKQIKMSFSENKTFQLWKNFMPIKSNIRNVINNNLFSIEVYNQEFFDSFNPNSEFIKWAGVEVLNFEDIPSKMESLIISEGLYAVFVHKGLASEGFKTYQYIFQTWLPDSVYQLDNRPHFAIMGEKYKNDSPDSEEEIYIPVKSKKYL